MRMRKPPHPGVFLKDEVIDPNELTITKSAKILGVSKQALSNLFSGKTSLTPEMALRFEKAFGLKMDTLCRMQISYDIAKTREFSSDLKVERYIQAS